MRETNFKEFLIKAQEKNPNFDFFSLKWNFHILKLFEALSLYQASIKRGLIIPDCFQEIKNGKRKELSFRINLEDIKDLSIFKSYLIPYDYEVIKTDLNFCYISSKE